MKIKQCFVFTLFCILFTGCGGSDNGETSSSAEGFSSIAGVWAWPNDGDGDEGYLVIRSNGTAADYDYAGDSFDNRGNCYWIDDSDQITHVSGHNYEIAYEYQGKLETDPVTIQVVSGGLMVQGVDEDGAYSLLFTSTNLLETDLTPEC
jgi:hypothetical protein